MAANTHSVDITPSNSYVLVPDSVSIDITGSITLEGWFKFSSLPGNAQAQTLMSRWDNTGPYDTFLWQIVNTAGVYSLEFLFVGNIGTDDLSVNFLSTPSAGVWYHLAMTWSTATKQIITYVNGVSQGTSSAGANASITNTVASLYIGVFKDGSGNPANKVTGLIDEIRMWNVVRSATEISANYRKQIGTDANMKLNLRFNNDYTDNSGNSNTGSGINSPVFSRNVPFGNAGGSFLFNFC